MIDFKPHPRIAISKSAYDPAIHDTYYRFNYDKIFADIAAHPDATRQSFAKSILRKLVLEDLFFVVYFLCENTIANHPFVVNQCHMVQDGPQTGTLDVWARGHFKAYDTQEPILTTNGWTTHGELLPGDRVFAPDGTQTTVVATTPVFTDADCYRVGFSNGYSGVVSGDHLWTTGNGITRSTKQLSMVNCDGVLLPKVLGQDQVSFVSITPVDSIPVSCIQVDREDGMYLVGRSFIPTHNSFIITTAETLQFHLKYPEKCTGILAYARPAAKKFLRAIKNICEQSTLLKTCFPDRIWQNPTIESPKWSEDEGLVFKRTSSSRGESTIEAWGLTEGMPTGRHFERLVFDDIETEDIAKSPMMLNEVYSKFDMAGNLSTLQDTDIIRVIGTYYSHMGPIKRIGDKLLEDGTPQYILRIVPASDNGKADGNPVFEGPETWRKSKASKHFNSQKLCNPTPMGDVPLDYAMLQPIEPEFMPKDRFKFMIIDQAGGDDTNVRQTSKGDMWSIGVVSIKPATLTLEMSEDDMGISDVYLEDLIADQMSHSEAIDAIVRMYMRNGMIMQLGVEKVGLSTTEIHVAEALKVKGRKLSVDHGNLVLLRPANRSLENRVEGALQWPLNNSHLFYSTAIAPVYRDKLIEEMKNFPVYHCDILNMWAYAYDMFSQFKFERHKPRGVVRSVAQIMAEGRIKGGW